MTTPLTCKNCGTPLPVRTTAGGRPADYCGTACRQSSYRKRRRGASTNDSATATIDAAVHDLAQDVVEEARHLLRILTRPDAPMIDPVEQAVALARSVDSLTAGLVGRARSRRIPWDVIGAALNMQPDTARRTYRADTVNRRIHNATRRDPAPPAEPPATNTPHHTRSHLAPVLSRLHRASQMPLRALAAHLGISPSQASRVLSGERFPSWWLTERFARACGADPQVLRTVWETEKLREDHPPESHEETADDDPGRRLPTALRTLHIQAGRPTPHDLASRHAGIDADQIEAAFNGDTPSWPQLARIITALSGDADYFHTLWKDQQPAGAVPVSPAATSPRTPAGSQPDDRLLQLFETFAPTLAATHPIR
ncbi:Helix-turn-helix domain-containing protein [Actinacidiphila alni]|uniref:Helix-turn-helix domain-containing protein n=1 Tax=Actinacidiphila alni TaxID=380248 RepID=A0A1I2MKG7_9ACTN|nr:helix-turn-helix transcriptional regulator [Actinacidiphila alni]SFF91558.1 Helix-turn-helix domain-containing protein [Actinacidiphila alni]